MSIFNDCIAEAIEQDRYIDIYRDNLSEDTIFGKILKRTDTFLCMSAINDDGFYDGIRIVKKEHVTRIRWGGKERSSIERIIKDYEVPSIVEKIEFKSTVSLIKSVNDLFGYIVIFVEEADPDICFIGEIEKIDDKDFLMREYGSIRSLDRAHLVVSLNEVTSISIDGIYERNIVQLHKDKS
jgi:hypothetical protein